LLVERLHGGLDREPGPDRPFRVVVVDAREAEDRHRGVADVLLDGSAVRLDDVADPLEVTREDAADDLGIVLVADRRRTDDAGEQHTDELPLLGHLRKSIDGSKRRGVRLYDPARANPLRDRRDTNRAAAAGRGGTAAG